ncbi:hypothetical protein [Absidia glauca]|uniref:Uncharacterized protein n=1 Tax=Absidia glauca TaxID=4829 RepID=A0A163LR92_ABSGL|nr:hypothetical protein [Absidia glauca]
MVDKSRMTLQKLARWHPNQSHPVQDRKGSTALWEGTLQPLDHEDLKQGALYIIKIHHVSVGLFQGWNDDMCCFAVLRSENTPMRWSQARYLPGDFDAFDAFDEAGNPPVHLWTRYLRVEVPINWFAIFEEARRKQREWATHILEQQQHHQQQQQQQQHHHHLHAPSALPAGMMMGGNNGGYPSLMTAMHHHQQHQQHSALMDDDYNDLGSFSAAPSQSLRSEPLSSISSLPLDPQHGNEAISSPISTQPTNISYSPPQSPTPSNLTASHSHQPDTTVPPVDEKAEINADRTTATNLNQKQHTTSTTTSSSSPNVTTGTTQIPLTPTSSLSPTTTTTTTEATAAATGKSTKRRSSVGVTPSQKLEMELALGDLSFPHDDDRFSIHSGYQPSLHLRDSSPTSAEMDPHGYHTNYSWKKRSIKKMLSRSSNSVK